MVYVTCEYKIITEYQYLLCESCDAAKLGGPLGAKLGGLTSMSHMLATTCTLLLFGSLGCSVLKLRS